MKSSKEPLDAILVDEAPKRAKFGLPRYSIFGLMVLTFFVAIAITPIYYALRAEGGETGFRAVAVLMAPVLPVLVMILASAVHSFRQWFKRRKQ